MTTENNNPDGKKVSVDEQNDDQQYSAKDLMEGNVPDDADVDIERDDEEEEGDEHWTNSILLQNEIDKLTSAKIRQVDGRYAVVQETEEGFHKHPITTYTLQLNSVTIDNKGEKKMAIEVVPASDMEDSYEVIVEPSIFSDQRKYKKEVQQGMTTTFSGKAQHLEDIRIKLSHQDAEQLHSTTKIGLHDDEIVLPSGSITNDENAEYKYTDDGQPIESKIQFEALQDYDEEEVQNILELLPQTRETHNITGTIGWYYAALFAPYIRSIESEIPGLFVVGETGAGKTATLEVMRELVGIDGEPESAEDTAFTLIRNLSSTTNIPIWLDEYKPSDIQDYQLNQLQGLLRKATRGGVEGRGNADKTVTKYELKSPFILSGEESIQGSAENRRVLEFEYRASTSKTGSETHRAWTKLTGGSVETDGEIAFHDGYDTIEHAHAIWDFVLQTSQEEFEEQWRDAEEYVHSLIQESGVTDIDDLELVGLKMLKVGADMYNELYQEVSGDGAVIDNRDIEDAIQYQLAKVGRQQRSSHTNEFIELVCDVINEGRVKSETDYRRVETTDDGTHLRFKLKKLHREVKKYVNDYDISSVDLLDDHEDYRSRMLDMASEEESYIHGTSVKTRNIGRCVSIKIEQANKEVDGFEMETENAGY